MNKLFIPAIAAACVLTLPALAAGNGSSNTEANMSPQNTAQIAQDIRQDLTKAGYTDIHIIPGSFVVHAKDSKGNPTEMMISPNSVTSVTAVDMPNSSGQGSSGQGSSSGSGSSSSK